MALAKQRRTRTNDPANTRSRVLDAAVQLFHRDGYAETSMRGIMEAAGVTSGALHHHYPTKKKVGIAVIRERVASMVEEAWVAPVMEAPSADKGVANAFKNIIGGLCEGAIVGCPLNNLALELAYAEPDFRREIQFIFEKWQGALSQRIAASHLIAKGSGVTPDELASLIVATYSGAMTLAKTAQSAKPLEIALKLLPRLWKQSPARV